MADLLFFLFPLSSNTPVIIVFLKLYFNEVGRAEWNIRYWIVWVRQLRFWDVNKTLSGDRWPMGKVSWHEIQADAEQLQPVIIHRTTSGAERKRKARKKLLEWGELQQLQQAGSEPAWKDFCFPYSRMWSLTRVPATRQGWLDWATPACPSQPVCLTEPGKVQPKNGSGNTPSRLRFIYTHPLKLEWKWQSQKLSCL